MQDHTALYQGNYYGPEGGTDSYAAAKRNFAVRSGLIPRSALFTPEQLAEVYRCIHETLESRYPITDERQKCLKSAAEQIERCGPDLEERVELSYQKEVKLTAMESPAGWRDAIQLKSIIVPYEAVSLKKGQRPFSFCPFFGNRK